MEEVLMKWAAAQRAVAALIATAALLNPPSARANVQNHPIGIVLFAGFQRYAMNDVNDAIRDFGRIYPGATGGAKCIDNGMSFGGGIRARVLDRVFVAFDAAQMQAASEGRTDISGLPYVVSVTIPAVGILSTVGYLAPLGGNIQVGLGAGIGYYFTTGQVRLRHDFLEVRADLDAEAFGGHGMGLTQVSLGRSMTGEFSVGYRHAKARSIRVDESELRRGDGSRVASDWSGPMAQLSLVYYLAR